MNDYTEYPEYKASGVEWISKIPSTWSLRKVENIANFLTGGTPPTGVQEYFEGDCTWVSISDLNNGVVLDSKRSLSTEGVRVANIPVSPEGSLLFSFKLSVGKVGIAGKNLYTNEAIATFIPSDKLETKFAFYSFPCTVVKSAKKNIYNADLLNSSMIREAKVPLPPLETQQRIVEFLDAETAHIDAGIANMESLIALLAEKRSTLISEVVTRGIPGEHTEFKDSGVEWLGEIPAEWDVSQVRDFFTERKERNDVGQNANYLSLMANRGVIPYAEKGNIGNKMPEDLSKTKKIFAGDFVINSMNYGIGSFGDSAYDGVCSSVYVVLTPRPEVYDKFAYLLLSNMDVARYAQSFGKGILAHRCAIGWDILKGLGMPRPPLGTQKKIVEFLTKETKHIDLAILNAKSVIHLMKEKRQTLISDVVTGKIDVRNSTN